MNKLELALCLGLSLGGCSELQSFDKKIENNKIVAEVKKEKFTIAYPAMILCERIEDKDRDGMIDYPRDFVNLKNQRCLYKPGDKITIAVNCKSYNETTNVLFRLRKDVTPESAKKKFEVVDVKFKEIKKGRDCLIFEYNTSELGEGEYRAEMNFYDLGKLLGVCIGAFSLEKEKTDKIEI